MNGEQLAMMMGLHEVMVACQTNDILDLTLESDSESIIFENRLFAKNNCRNAKVKIVQTFESLQYEASHVRALLLILIPAHSLSLS